VDDAFSFFVHCYHIRDWIIELNRAGLRREDVDAFVNQHRELRICADLCNGTKHCYLTRPKTDRQPHVATQSFDSRGVNGVMHTTKGKFRIMSDGKFYDALELAESCMKLWDEFINRMDERTNDASETTP